MNVSQRPNHHNNPPACSGIHTVNTAKATTASIYGLEALQRNPTGRLEPKPGLNHFATVMISAAKCSHDNKGCFIRQRYN